MMSFYCYRVRYIIFVLRISSQQKNSSLRPECDVFATSKICRINTPSLCGKTKKSPSECLEYKMRKKSATFHFRPGGMFLFVQSVFLSELFFRGTFQSQRIHGTGIFSWLVNLPPPNVPPQKYALIKGLLTIGFP